MPISIRSGLLASAALLLAACSSLPPTVSRPLPPSGGAVPAAFAALPGWPGEAPEQSLAALRQSCSVLVRKPGWASVCQDAAGVRADDPAAVRQFFETRFTPWRLQEGGRDTGLVTGYYIPLLSGSLSRSDRTPWPVYGVPSDLLSLTLPREVQGKSSVSARMIGNRLQVAAGGPVEVVLSDFGSQVHAGVLKGRLRGNRFVPYATRGEIDRGQGVVPPVLAWVEDPVELFFMQVQGSGRLQLDDGRILTLRFADTNGLEYQSIGNALIRRGQITMANASMEGIKRWVAAHPDQRQSVFDANPRYVFFQAVPTGGDTGPQGALGVPLTPGYSIAADPRYVPLGTPVYLATTWPSSNRPLQRLMHAQDTGSAIRGAVRADFFWGSGAEAGLLAGSMKQSGSAWLLLPNGMNAPNF